MSSGLKGAVLGIGQELMSTPFFMVAAKAAFTPSYRMIFFYETITAHEKEKVTNFWHKDG